MTVGINFAARLSNNVGPAHYREILRSINASHQTLSFKDAHELGRDILKIVRFVLMRHDVEFSVPAALRMAEIDHAEDIRSTFFFLQVPHTNVCTV